MMNRIEFGDCREIMQRWAAEGIKVQTCVTSPPYFGLRDYGHENQIGLEQTPDEYVSNMVDVFRCVRDVLSDDGTLWLNLGDSYAAQRNGKRKHASNDMDRESQSSSHRTPFTFLTKPKDLIGIPWRIAFALQADGWYLRQDIIWHKPNPMPESVRDRCTKAHEYIFLLSKSERYYFDSASMREPANTAPASRNKAAEGYQADYPKGDRFSAGERVWGADGKRNRRSVWTVATKPYKGAHFATFPPALIEPCILAGSKPGDIVLDPFMGSGTTAEVAMKHMRKYLGCELNSTYKELQDKRLGISGVDCLSPKCEIA